MNFNDYLTEKMAGCGHSATKVCGIKLQKDHDTGEHSATVEKDHKGMLKVAKLHNHLTATGWTHKEHPSGHVYSHPHSRHTLTIYHKSHAAGGEKHHEIVLGHH